MTRLKQLAKDECIFIIADESEVRGSKYFHILFGLLSNPQQLFLLESIHLHKFMDANTTLRLIDDAIKFLDISREQVTLLISDAARYMVKAGQMLKALYSQMLHVLCIAHLLHNCTDGKK